jgi:hypothetical protein
MFNPGFEAAIVAARCDLAPGGHFALVDFHAAGSRAFARWMGVNHVRMDGQLRPLLHEKFSTVHDELLVVAPESIAEAVRGIVQATMIEAMADLFPQVPIEVEASVVTHWGEK